VSSIRRNTSLQTDDSSTSVVRRLAAVLDAFRARDVYLGVNEIARRTQLPKSTVSRLVKEMHEAGFLERKAEKVGLGLQMEDVPSFVELRWRPGEHQAALT